MFSIVILFDIQNNLVDYWKRKIIIIITFIIIFLWET